MSPGGLAHAKKPDTELIAGTGIAGYSGDGGPAVEAELNHPGGVAAADDGAIFLSDTGNHVVRRIADDGTISTVAGSGELGEAAQEWPADAVPADEVALSLPGALAVAEDGTIYIADQGLYRVFAVSPDGELSVVAGNGTQGFDGDGALATDASLGAPSGVAVAEDGTIYIADTENGRVRAVSPDGEISTVAGNGGSQVNAAGGRATDVPVPAPSSLAVDADQNLWIANAGLLQRLDGDQLSTIVEPEPGEWGPAQEPEWPPADQEMNNITTVAAGADGQVHAADGSSQQTYHFNANGNVTSSEKIDLTLDGPMAVDATGTVLMVDNSESRLYAISAAEDSATSDSGGIMWIVLAAVGAVVVLAAVLWIVMRRAKVRRS